MSDIAATATVPAASKSLLVGVTKIPHIHNFRGLAVIFIVATHSLSIFDWTDHAEVKRWFAYGFANGTLFFLFISGYLFEHLSGRFRVLDFWSKKLRFVVLPYVVMSIPAIFMFTHGAVQDDVRVGFYDQPVWLQSLEFLLTGAHIGPFWFIPTIVVFYAMAPILITAFRRDSAFVVLPLLFLIPLWVPRSHNALMNFGHFLAIWVLGMACCRFRLQTESLLRGHLLPLLLLAIVLAAAELAFTAGTHTYLGYLQKVALMLFLLAALLRLGRRQVPLLTLTGNLSFGIYFVHPYVIYAGKLGFTRLAGNLPEGGVWGVAVAAVVALAVSVAVVTVVRRVLGPRSRFVIGV
ncbi:MAG: acyltransferase [Pseudomonadota bacterium]|nr:acyltransferase [Pseudomonadota bacterium]